MTTIADQIRLAHPTASCSAEEIAATWARCSQADPCHPYLVRYRLPPMNLRQVGEFLVAPLHDLDGNLAGLRLLDAHGEEDVWPKTAIPLPYITGDAAHSATVVRGTLADAMAIRIACGTQVLQIPLAADAAALRAAMLALRPERTVLIAEASMAAAATHGHPGQRIHHVAAPPPGLSWSLLHVGGGTRVVRSWMEDPIVHFGGALAPRGILVRQSGTWIGSTRIGGPVGAIAFAHDEDQDRWRRVIYLQDRDGNERLLLIPEQLILLSPRQTLVRLIDAGLEINDKDAAGYLIAHLAGTQVKRRLLLVRRGGWHGEHYVGPAGTVGPERDTVPVLERQLELAPQASAEALAIWRRDIGRLAEGNSRLVAALGVAFAGMAIGLLEGQIGVGVHLRGLSSLGKTTALRVAASVYGPAHEQVRSWRATDAGLETMAVQHHHRALCLDELAQITADAAAQSAYLLANGAGRQRASATGRGVPRQTWQLTFLSSGEIALADKVAEHSGSPQVREGQAVRLIDLAADAGLGHGLFEALHDHASGASLSDALNRASGPSTGDVATAFAQALSTDLEAAKAMLIAERDRFVRDHLPADADGIVRRVFANLGLLAAACEAATRYGILPWRSGSGHAGLAICARDWLAAWQQPGHANSPLRIAQAWLSDHVDSFTPWTQAAQRPEEVAYVREQPRTFYLRAEGWRRLCGKVRSRQMRAALAGAGCLQYANARVPNGKVAKFYTIDGSALSRAIDEGRR